MKRNIMCVVSLVFCICILICANTFVTNAESSFYSSATTVAIKNNIEKDASLNNHVTAQGACTDSKYAYIAINNGTTTLLKYDVNTWELKKKKHGLILGHANDMTYNANTNTIVVANNSPDFDVVSFVDPDTLSVIQTKKIDYKIYSIAYNATYGRYVVGISGTYDFAILDNDFKLIKEFKGYESGYLRQGCDCDDSYLYFCQSGGGGNVIVVYDWNGNFIDIISISKSLEIENIFHVSNTIYVTFHYYGNSVYRIGINDKTAIKYTVKYDSNGASGKMDSTTVTYGNKKTLSECKFEKEGYSFGGWIIKRDSSNKYYGKSSPYSKSEWLNKEDIYEYTLYGDKTEISKTTNVGNVTATAFWIADEYEIHYDSNTGVGDIPMASVNYSDVYTLENNAFYKQGYVFTGYYATRSYDLKTFGYSKNQSEPKWLYSKDIDKKYIFKDTQDVTQMTYGGKVTLYANWQFAFNFSSSDTKLDSYVGIDKDVVFPDQYTKVDTIADEAFADRTAMHSVTFPSSVTTLGDNLFKNCTNLQTIYFKDKLPLNVSHTSLDGATAPVCILKKHDRNFLLGIYYNHFSYKTMTYIYKSFFQ